MTEVRTFGVRDADEYWRRRERGGRASERRLHRFLAGMIDRLAGAGGTVLDCGVGSGHVFRLCHERQQMYGIEASAHAIAGYEFPADRIRQADMNDGIPDFGVAFDVVLASMVLHWLDDPAEFLRHAVRRLKPGGSLLVVIPNITYYRYRIAYLFGRFPPISLSHKNVQTPVEFEAMARRCDLAIRKRTSPKCKLRAKLWPRLFSQDVVYVLQPRQQA